MKKMKTEIRLFSIVEYEKEQKYLEKRHEEGWKFTGVNFPGFYHFERCEPEAMIYQLDYNQEGLAQKEEYVQMFRDCGWEYLMDFVGYSYFRKPAAELKEDEGIFCDDSSRLEMMNRVFRGRMLPLLGVFLCIIIPQLFIQMSWNALKNPLFYTFAVLLVFYLVLFFRFGIQYLRFKKNIGK